MQRLSYAHTWSQVICWSDLRLRRFEKTCQMLFLQIIPENCVVFRLDLGALSLSQEKKGDRWSAYQVEVPNNIRCSLHSVDCVYKVLFVGCASPFLR